MDSSETSGAVNGGNKNVHFAPDAPLNSGVSKLKLSAVADEACLTADAPLSVRPRESQTLSAVAAGRSVAHDELCLFPPSY